MNEINKIENETSIVESRLLGLNQILSGLRSKLETDEQGRVGLENKFEDLRQSFSQLSSQTNDGNKEQIELIESWESRVAELEERISSAPAKNNDEVENLESKLSNLNETLNSLRENLEASQSEESVEPFNTEEIDSKIESIQEYYGVMEKHIFAVEEKQDQQLLRLQQLELGREEILAKTRELWSLSNEFKGSVQDQDGRLDFFEKEKSDIKDKIGEVELELATKFDGNSEAWNQAMDEFKSFYAKFEVFQKELSLGVSQALEQSDKALQEQKRLEDEKVALKDQLNQVDDVKEDIKTIRDQSAQFEEQVQSAQLGHEILVDGVKVEMSTLHEKVEDFKKKFEDEVEQKSKSLNKELVLARDSQYDQHQKVQKQLDQVKQQQREIGNLKENLEEKEKETKELKHEVRILKNEMGALYRQLRQQKTMAIGAIAAAVVMSVGLSYIITPSFDETAGYSSPIAMIDETLPATFQEASFDLDAPEVEVEEVYLETNTVAVDKTDFFGEAEEAQSVENVVEAPIVSPAFTKEENSNSKPKPGFVEYTVRDGDSLWAIAKKHRGQGALMERIEKIQRDNKLKNPGSIKDGQVLRIFL